MSGEPSPSIDFGFWGFWLEVGLGLLIQVAPERIHVTGLTPSPKPQPDALRVRRLGCRMQVLRLLGNDP